jgi:hypothetical protein
MSTRSDKDRLDELIFRTINTEKPQFDAEKWKQKYPDEYQTLISRREKAALSRQPDIWKVIFGKPAIQLAAAAAIIVVVGLLTIHQNSNEQVGTVVAPDSTQSPAYMRSILSLNIAYRRGGIEAVDRQCQRAMGMLGPRPAEITIEQILTEFNGT